MLDEISQFVLHFWSCRCGFCHRAGKNFTDFAFVLRLSFVFHCHDKKKGPKDVNFCECSVQMHFGDLIKGLS